VITSRQQFYIIEIQRQSIQPVSVIKNASALFFILLSTLTLMGNYSVLIYILHIHIKITNEVREMTEEAPIQIQDRDYVLAADDGIEWRYGKRPDYSKTDKTLRAQSELHHPPGSLEAIVQNLVRTFEMEATYKLNPHQWTSIDLDQFRMRTNNGPEYTAFDVAERGTYTCF
jgi:hypothetical protein